MLNLLRVLSEKKKVKVFIQLSSKARARQPPIWHPFHLWFLPCALFFHYWCIFQPKSASDGEIRLVDEEEECDTPVVESSLIEALRIRIDKT